MLRETFDIHAHLSIILQNKICRQILFIYCEPYSIIFVQIEVCERLTHEELLLLQYETLWYLDRKPFSNYRLLISLKLLFTNLFIHNLRPVRHFGLRTFESVLFEDTLLNLAIGCSQGTVPVPHSITPLPDVNVPVWINLPAVPFSLAEFVLAFIDGVRVAHSSPHAIGASVFIELTVISSAFHEIVHEFDRIFVVPLIQRRPLY